MTRFYAENQGSYTEISLRTKRGLLTKEVSIPVAEWEHKLPENILPVMAVLNNILEASELPKYEDRILLQHSDVSMLTDSEAHILGLPPSVPYAFDIKTSGTIDQSTFSISTSWVNAGGAPEFGVEHDGAFVKHGKKLYRIPSPLYEIVQAAYKLADRDQTQNSRYEALANLHQLIPQDNRVKTDKYLGSIRVLHASAFSLQLPIDGESFQFNPVLFSRKALGRAEESGRILDEAESLLTDKLQAVFSNDRFKRWQEARDCYAIDNGFYVYIDSDLKKALNVVRQMQKANVEERKSFIRYPQRYIKEALSGQITEDYIERLFVETEQYADNVRGIGLWQPPVLPWIVKEPNSWLPERFGLKIGDQYLQIEAKEVPSFRERAQAAYDSGFSSIEHNGINIPINKESIQQIEKLQGIATPLNMGRGQLDNEYKANDNIGAYKHFLIVDDNFNDLTYKINPIRRLIEPSYNLPVVLKSILKEHQKEGLKWLIDSWSDGLPGVLLADDMGLGKTLQALVFLAWIREQKQKGHAKCKWPLLIIAPTALLNNWQREIESHLHESGLGEICLVYGKNLTQLRSQKVNDIQSGKTNLNRNELMRADVVLTTYETYRDYHHSFAGVRFSVAVLDEAQKIKNPKSQVNRAIESLNSDFVITMTGTPIENAIEDLWTIMQRTWPGYLGSLKDFSSSFSPDNYDSLASLTLKLKEPAYKDSTSPVLCRRMKEDILGDLPRKIPHFERLHMPPKQADIYRKVIAEAKGENAPPMLHTLHSLRGISLHPTDPNIVMSESSYASFDAYIADSARLSKTFEILDRIHEIGNDKVLLFIESLNMQGLVAEIIKKRYGLKNRPFIINGKTGADRIQKAADSFQENSDFDVMILSPKVGGVGLTLTAANHVIHLSRWWNPAVEDQATDRVYRIGQKKEVHVYYPIALHPDTEIREHSFDEKLNSLLQRKRQLSRDMLLPPENSKDAENLFKETVGFTTDTQSIRIDELDNMGPIEFERWVLGKASQAGYKTDATQQTHDFRADGIITHIGTNQKFILQCKHCTSGDRYSHEKVIEDLLIAKRAYDPEGDAGLVALTNAFFAPALLRKMEKHGIRHFDRDNIINWPML